MRMAELAMDRDVIAGIGHNQPPEPTPIERAESAMIALSNFLNETPVITEPAHLVEAKRLVEHARGAAAELEDERVALVMPLNTKVTEINGRFKALHNTDSKKPGTLDRVLNELKARLTTYAVNEEKKRAMEAEIARVFANKAEQEARDAEAAERQAKQDAVVGVVDTGVAEAIQNADEKFAEYEAASRFAARAERDAKFRIGDGHGKALAMRTEKTLVLEHYGRALKAIGPNEKIKDAILSAARDYRKLHGVLPDGISETSERKF
jgi:hypothetical protein